MESMVPITVQCELLQPYYIVKIDLINPPFSTGEINVN